MWEKKYEVRPENSRDHGRSRMLIRFSIAYFTGRTSEISRIQGGIGRACSEHGRPVIQSFPVSCTSFCSGFVPSQSSCLCHDLTRVHSLLFHFDFVSSGQSYTTFLAVNGIGKDNSLSSLKYASLSIPVVGASEGFWSFYVETWPKKETQACSTPRLVCQLAVLHIARGIAIRHSQSFSRPLR